MRRGRGRGSARRARRSRRSQGRARGAGLHAAQASTLLVTSEPVGARIHLGDTWIGTTPFELPIDAGSHEVQVELDGYIAQRQRIDAVAGERLSLAFTLQPSPSEPLGSTGPRVGLLRGLGASALGLGLGGTLAGAVLIAIDERPITSDCSGDNVDVAGHCRWRHATLEPGIALVSGGAALLGTGIALLVRARKPAGSSSARLRVEPRAGGLSLSF